MEKFWFCYWW